MPSGSFMAPSPLRKDVLAPDSFRVHDETAFGLDLSHGVAHVHDESDSLPEARMVATCIIGRMFVDPAGRCDEARQQTVPMGIADEAEGIDRITMAADAGTEANRYQAEGVRLSSVKHFPYFGVGHQCRPLTLRRWMQTET